MTEKYTLTKTAEFYEVFDTQAKETVYVSESSSSAKLALMQLRKSGVVEPKLKEVK